MAQEQTVTVSLEEFGLSSYEARAYVTLISKGALSASELSYYAELPRTKVYPVLLKLEKKKLVIISKSKPIICNAISPEDAFDEIIHEQIDKVNAMNSLVSNLKKISEDTKKSQGSEEKRYFHLNANNVLNQLIQMIEGSKTSIHIIADPCGMNLLSECKEQLVGAIRRDIDIKIIISSSQIGSEHFRKIPDGIKIRIADVVQNDFIFDNTELLIIDNRNGKGAVFSSTDVLGNSQSSLFNNTWKHSLKTECIADMNKNDAQEVFEVINLIESNGLNYILNSTFGTKNNEIDLLKLLEKNGVNMRTKSLEDVIELIDCVLQIKCSGHVTLNSNNKNITIESKLNSGHSLPWASVLEKYLKNQGYKTRMVLQNHSNKYEKVHIKISS